MDDTANKRPETKRSEVQAQDRQRPVSDRPKMPREQRAKQFAPFDALTGLSERLRQAEEEHGRMLEAAGLVHAAEEEQNR